MRFPLGKLVTSVASGAALVGGLHLANRLVLLDDLPPTLPGAMHDWTWRGWRVRYTTLGQGRPIVLVHGVHAAASSFEMRNIFEPLAQQHAAFAVDLLGFGKSERPDAPYSGALYAELVADFLRERIERPAVLVGSSLSATYVVAAARSHPDLVDRVILFSPTSVTSTGAGGQAFARLLSVPVLGQAAFNLLVSHASIQSYLRRAYADATLVDDTLVGQNWATAHQPDARLAPAAFVAGHLDLPFDTNRTPIAAPILVLRGDTPGIGAQASDAELRALGPRVTIETVGGTGQLPHDEAPDRVLGMLTTWLAESHEK